MSCVELLKKVHKTVQPFYWPPQAASKKGKKDFGGNSLERDVPQTPAEAVAPASPRALAGRDFSFRCGVTARCYCYYWLVRDLTAEGPR